MSRFFRSPLTWLIAGLLAVAAGGVYWQIGQQQRRESAERARIAAEQQEQRRTAEVEIRRNREQQQFQEDMQTQKEAEEKQRQMDIEFRQDELKRKKFTADDRPTQSPLNAYYATTEERSRREAERREQYEDETAMQRARADVERQRRGLEQREMEEQAARARRESAARETPAPAAVPPSEPAGYSGPPIYAKPPKPKP